MTWVTPFSQHSDFPSPLDFDSKVRIFREQVLGWQLDIADACINGRVIQSDRCGPIRHSGYGVLNFVLSYFELIAKAKDGYTGRGRSDYYFKNGVRDVFPELLTFKAGDVDDVLTLLYNSARCGLYHSGATSGRVRLLGEGMPPLAFDPQRRMLVINPHTLVPRLRRHFEDYISDLGQPGNAELRENFGTRFDCLWLNDPLGATAQ